MAKKATNSVSIPVVASIVGGAFLLLSMAKGSSVSKVSFLGRNDLPRGIRNNNPGNIEKNPNNNWLGKIEGNDPRFESFETFAYGTRAMIKLIKNYIDRGHNTVWKVISRWAPVGSDNNPTSSYAGQIASQTGIGLYTTIEPDKETLRKLIQAIADFENGQKNVISNEMFEAAYLLI